MTATHRLRLAARVACLANLLASAAMIFFLQEGLDSTRTIPERLSSIAAHTLTWQLSWFSWIVAAMTLIHLFICWGLWLDERAKGEKRALIIFGVLIGCLGMIPDTLAETLALGLLPNFVLSASSAPADLFTIAAWLRAINLMTGFLGNGFYCVGGLVLNVLSYRLGSSAKFFCLGFLIWLPGLVLSIATLLDWLPGLYVFTAVTMAAFTVCSAWIAQRLPENITS